MSDVRPIIEAIESEIKNPYPSHVNLARLVSVGFRYIQEEIENIKFPLPSHTETVGTQTVTVKNEKPKRSKKGIS